MRKGFGFRHCLLPFLTICVSAGQSAAAQAPASPPTVTPRSLPLIIPPPVVPHIAPKLTPLQRQQLETMLAGAAAHGLPQDSAPAMPRSDAALVEASMDYARAVHSGRLNATDFLQDWGLRPEFYDPWPAFLAAAERDALPAWVASLPPPYVGYETLRKGLAVYRQIQQAGSWPVFPSGPDMTIGAKGERVLLLRRRLAVEDPQVARNGDTFDTALLDAVRRAQRRYGLNPSGIVSGQTTAALNVTVKTRIDQIKANMERWRWLPQTLTKDRVQVNIAAAVLTVFDGDMPVTSMRAVTGRPGNETPMLQSQINSIVINPPWNVPSSIATKELWPKERANPGYLKRNSFRVISLPGGGTRLQQAAGSKSALGRLKFDFENRYAVYLHDTPTQATFSRYDRLASHGCVRLEKPLELANLLLKDDPAWPDGSVASEIAKGATRRVQLQKPVTVYLFYWTAFATQSGQMSFRDDPYGWDAVLASRIEKHSDTPVLAGR